MSIETHDRYKLMMRLPYVGAEDEVLEIVDVDSESDAQDALAQQVLELVDHWVEAVEDGDDEDQVE